MLPEYSPSRIAPGYFLFGGLKDGGSAKVEREGEGLTINTRAEWAPSRRSRHLTFIMFFLFRAKRTIPTRWHGWGYYLKFEIMGPSPARVRICR